MDKDIGIIKFTGHSTKRMWSIYVIKSIPKIDSDKVYLYVGKVGDNNIGCNPVLSRIGNHFSFNSAHSQSRNRVLGKTEDYNYEMYYLHLKEYNIENHSDEVNMINESERTLNRRIQFLINDKPNFTLSNILKDAGRKSLIEERKSHITESIKQKIHVFSDVVIGR